MAVVLKLKHEGEVRRVLVEEAEMSYEKVSERVQAAWPEGGRLMAKFLGDGNSYCVLCPATFPDFLSSADAGAGQKILRLELEKGGAALGTPGSGPAIVPFIELDDADVEVLDWDGAEAGDDEPVGVALADVDMTNMPEPSAPAWDQAMPPPGGVAVMPKPSAPPLEAVPPVDLGARSRPMATGHRGDAPMECWRMQGKELAHQWKAQFKSHRDAQRQILKCQGEELKRGKAAWKEQLKLAKELQRHPEGAGSWKEQRQCIKAAGKEDLAALKQQRKAQAASLKEQRGAMKQAMAQDLRAWKQSKAWARSAAVDGGFDGR